MADALSLRERTGQPAPAQLLRQRAGLAQQLGSIDLHNHAQEIGGLRTIRFGANGPARATVVHFHGGGFRQGQPEMVAGYAAALSRGGEVSVCCPAYRLAPENPFPAALNDGLRILAALAAEKPRRLILAGDSAGGGLAASLALLCAGQGIEISGVLLHSPWLDLTVSNACYEANGECDPLFSRAAATEAQQLYLQGHPASDPLASPLFGDLSQFSPVFISVGSGEVLLGDTLSLHERLRAARRKVELCQVEGMDHIAVTRGLNLPGAQQVLAETISFVRQVP